MTITAFDIEPVVLKKDDPEWKFALGASPVTEGVILRIATDEAEGFGYASATAHMGSITATLMAELEHFRPLVMGSGADEITAILQKLDRRLRGAPQAKAAVDCALHDLLARRLNVPVSTLLGGVVRNEVPILRILAIKSPEQMAAQARRLVDQGYRYLKIKVHGEVDLDVARVAAIRREAGADVHLTIDANQAYSPKDAVTAILRMAEHGIELVEQPVAAEDIEGLSLVTRMVPVVVEADEAAGSLAEVHDLVCNRRVDAVSLKIPKLGGIRNTLAAAQLCEAAGIRYRLGAAVGSRLLSAFAIHVACALPGADYACELGEFERLLEDPFTGLAVENGMLRLPAGPGAGVRRIDGPGGRRAEGAHSEALTMTKG
ncbi:mandelate racemase/muconate lactonizing enzyme family protein [Rhizobium binxianense]